MKTGKFKILLPFVHYRLEIPELLQGILMIAVGLSTVPVLQETLGLSYSAALTAVAIAEALGLLHVLFGDPVVPGWIASALSLVLTFLAGYTVGIDSIHALIALQLLLAVIFIVLGATGLAHKLVSIVPASLKSGILLGAAIAALSRVLGDGGYLARYPLSVGSGSIVALFVLFSVVSKKLKDRSKIYREITKYGMLSSLIVAMAVGFISGELPLPVIKWGFIPFSFGELFQTASVFSVGLPSLKTFIAAAPVALAVYIVAFGEIITAETVLDDCQKARPEEPLDFNSNRTNIIAGVRNLILALFCPFTALAGPLWAAVTVSIGERYKEGKKSMKSLFGGLGSFKLSTALCVVFMPVASLLEPILPVALAATLVVQAFACAYIAIEQVKDDRAAAGTAGITGATVFIASLNWALLVGILSYIIIEGGTFGLKKPAFRINEKRRGTMKKENLVITIEQEYASGGTEIAKALAQRLNVPCYDGEIVERAAQLSGISLKLLQRYDEKPVTAAYDLTADSEAEIAIPPASQFTAARMMAVKALAQEGSCVLVDRSCHGALSDMPNCVHIFIHSDDATRIEAMGGDKTAARRELKKADKQRKKFYRSCDEKWGVADSYHICIDTSELDCESSTQQILYYLNSVTGQVFCNPAEGKAIGA